jgi:thiaminase/transcriptional activator TenA
VRAVISVTDAAAADASAIVRAKMMTAFERCCQLEWLFWDGAYRQRTWPV